MAKKPEAKKYNSFRFNTGDVFHSRKPKTRAKALRYMRRRVGKADAKSMRVVYAHMIWD